MTPRLFIFCVLSSVSSNLFSQVSPSVVWEKKYGYGKQRAYDAVVLPDGGILTVGQSGGYGGGTTAPDHHGTTDSTDAWVIKLDTAGNKLWEKSIGGTANDFLSMILPSGDGNYICFGISSSLNGDLAGNTAKGAWVLKMSANGNILWSKTYAGHIYEALHPITKNCLGTVLSDGGIALSSLSAGGFSVLRLNAGGDILWRSTPDNLTGKYVVETNDHKLLTSTGLMFDAATGDTSRFPAFPVSPYNNNEQYPPNDMRALKNINGTIWVAINETAPNKVGYYDEASHRFILQGWSSNYDHGAGGPEYAIDGNGLAVLRDNSPIISGYGAMYSVMSGFIGNCPLYYTGGGLVPLYNLSGGFFPGGSYTAVKALPGGEEFLIAGTTSDFKFWIIKNAVRNNIRGNVFYDANDNNVLDAGEVVLDNFNVKSAASGLEVSSKPLGGYFNNNVDTGAYTTSVVLDGFPYLSASPASKASVFTTYKNTDSVNFAIHKLAAARDYAVSLAALSRARPSFPVTYKIDYSNIGTDTLLNKTIRFIKDSRLNLVQTNPLFDAISGDTLSWNISNVKPFEQGVITVSMIVGSAGIGQGLTSSVFIDSTGDINTTDNTGTLAQVVTGAFDPNDKSEVHGNVISKMEVQTGKYLTYTIRFQNTGNDTAFNIFVRDTLDAKLDWTTIEMVSASHPYQLKVKDGKYVEWKFNNIQLVDSFQNEPGSHGYITYRIKPKTTLVLDDVINNSASIYFDFNAPVKTNTQSNTVVKTTAIWTGEKNAVWEDAANWNIKAVPDGETIVIVPANVPHYPVVNSNAACFALRVDTGATITVNTGFNLGVTGK